ATFHGYGPEQGYGFLREAIAENDYRARGIEIDTDEIFISDGAKSDTGNIGDILSADCVVAVTDPVYPVYVDTNIMAGRSIVYLPCTPANNFVPELPEEDVDVIYLCYPNNPTGTVLTRSELQVWVDYARAKGALLLYDSAYEAYVTESDVPRSIYEIEGARDVAVEFRSYSKTAGFTGLRCGYTVVPKTVTALAADGQRVALNRLWNRRQCTKFNGASYVIQRGAEALYTEAGKADVSRMISYYLRNAKILREGMASAGLNVWGGVNSPYVWVKTPEGMSSWQFFDVLLGQCGVAGTPGCGFGRSGEGFFRLTAFNTHDNTLAAVEQMQQLRY
ncbi:MAG: LL-diaminopimelate aminotransferase, partial [Muribaculaceae bacterium]|nr:LL-diaminopimelate aminotransferase [Muribaculaceae bacterium]